MKNIVCPKKKIMCLSTSTYVYEFTNYMNSYVWVLFENILTDTF